MTKKKVKKRTVEMDPGLFLIAPERAIATVLEPFDETDRKRLIGMADNEIKGSRGNKSQKERATEFLREAESSVGFDDDYDWSAAQTTIAAILVAATGIKL
jgi:hypothetical protein